jgi:K+-transporting ATPase ATPase C chain
VHSVWKTSIRFTLVTTVLLGLAYPLVLTGIAGVLFPHQASGSLILKDGHVIGSSLLAQSFTSDRYFHPRPSAAGNGYDATSSGGSNLAQSNQKLVQRITPDSAYYQVHRVAIARHLSDDSINKLVAAHITPRTLGVLGEPRVNVLELNLDLDQLTK